MSLTCAEASGGHLTLSSPLIWELAAARGMLRTTTERCGPAVIIRAGGELDASNEVTWQRLLAEAAGAASAPGPLIVDTSGLDFMGCCAFSVLADEAGRCRHRGVDLRLVTPAPTLAPMVAACALGELLPVHDSVDAALLASMARITHHGAARPNRGQHRAGTQQRPVV
jgi:anti-anti-sigma factor